MNQKPTQKVLWPNVALTSLPQFETSLDTWFGRKNIPVWITEYGNETKPGEPKGVTEAQQASYLTQAIDIAKKDKRVPMFIWFVMRDSAGSLWQSGIYRTTGGAKPAQPKFAAAARPLNPVNGKLSVKGGTKNPAVTVYLRAFCANNPVGAKVGLDVDDEARREARRRTRSRSSRSASTARSPTASPVSRSRRARRTPSTVDANTTIGGSVDAHDHDRRRLTRREPSHPGREVAPHRRPGGGCQPVGRRLVGRRGRRGAPARRRAR